jgi:tetratricopeptide (TPR) repeat protein
MKKTGIIFLIVMSITCQIAEAEIVSRETLVKALRNKDHVKVIKHATILAEKANDPFAQITLGEYYFWGKGTTTKDYAAAYKWFKMAADLKNHTAQNYLGTMYEEGLGVKKDCKRAMAFYMEASSHFTGQYSMGMVYKEGTCYKKNTKAAIFWFKQAANQGFEPAITALRELNAISKNEAESLLNKSKPGCFYKDEVAKQKSEEYYATALKLIEDREDYSVALSYITKSALMGNPGALTLMCRFKSDLRGPPIFWTEGYAWCQVAIDTLPRSYLNERNEIIRNFKKVKERLSEADLKEAKVIIKEINSQMQCD